MVYYRPVTLDDYNSVRDLLNDAGMQHYTAEESRLRRMIDNADRTVGAFVDDDRLVGFVSALCDEAFNGSIGPFAIHPDYIGQGIEAELAGQIIEDSPEINWLIHPNPTTATPSLWQSHGFTTALGIMERAPAR